MRHLQQIWDSRCGPAVRCRAGALGLVLIVTWIAAFSAQPVYCQSFGSVLGTVSDPSGAVLSGVTVALTNTNTGDRRDAVTNASGFYQILNVLPGIYKIDVESSGFRHFTRQSIEVKTLDAVRIDIPLVIGSITESVEVTESSVLLETDKSSMGTTISGVEVQQLPVNGRNPMSLVQLVPGVIPQAGAVGQAGFIGAGNFQVSGAFGNQSAQYLDGAPVNSPYGNTVALVPPQDAVQEFRVSTNNADAEFGRSSGGSITMTIKGGTNEFHGSAYEYWRNKVLNAADYFAAQTNNPNPPFNQHQYGVTFGGPIKKDKAFFFFSWENYSVRQASPYIANVPTQAFLQGDFSALIPAGTNCDATPIQGCIFDPTNQKAFQDNKIPSNRFDQTANYIANVQKIWPMPNANLPTGNYATTNSTGNNTRQFNVRTDYNLSNKQRLFFRYTDYRGQGLKNDPFGSGIGGAATPTTTIQIVVGDSYSFSPSMMGEIHLSYLRTSSSQRQINNKPSTDMGAYGTNWAFLNTAASCKGSPALGIDSITWAGNQGCTDNIQNIYSMSGSISKSTHGHTLKFGGEIRRPEFYYNALWFPVGTYSFAASTTSGGGNSATGVGFASFLLGAMQAGSGQLNNGFMTAGIQFYQAYFVSDSFQVHPRLTLNLGLRYELPGGFSEKKDRETVFLPNSPNAVLPDFNGNIALVNSPDWPYRINQKPQHHLFAPRVGFAYRATNSLIFRAGYGITYTSADASQGLAPFNSAINASTTTPYGPSFSNPFPNGIVQAPGRDPSFQTTFLGQSFLFPSPGVYPNEKYPYVQQWNFNIQQQLGKSSVIQVGYVGSKGTHLPTLLVFLNQLPPQYFNAGPDLLKMVPNPMFGKLPSTASPLLAAPVIFQGLLWKPIPQFFPWVTAQNQSFGSSIYHSLQASFRKQFASGGLITAAYTWAKLLSDVDTTTPMGEGAYMFIGGGSMGGQNAYDRRAERGPARYDVPHRLVVSYALDLPFGKGKRWLNTGDNLAAKLFSNWGVNGITTFQSGVPLVIQTVAPTLRGLPLDVFMGITPFGLRPNAVAGCNKNIDGSVGDRLNMYFNTACFSQPAVVGFGNPFGNQPMNDPHLRSQGVANFDFSIYKSMHVSERLGMQFRVEAFNIFNRTQFAPPGGTFNPATLGTAGDTFGKITSTANAPRQIQLAMRFQF